MSSTTEPKTIFFDVLLRTILMHLRFDTIGSGSDGQLAQCDELAFLQQ
jgi:hypothetical protein